MVAATFNAQFNNTLDGFSAYRLRAVQALKFGMQNNTVTRTSKLLWLYLNTLDRVDPTSQNNYLSDTQVAFIIEQVTTLIGNINGPV